MPNCLNCGAALQGPFCGQCGQRVIPPYPTLREMAADAWHEFSGWDGRFVRTFRTLLHPGALTIDVMEGRRARYVSPLRLYLVASVFYFLVAAAIPNLRPPAAVQLPGAKRTIDLTRPVSAEDRALAQQQLDRAPWWARALMQPMLDDPARQRTRFLQTFPRALFALVPLFAAIVGLFYRRRPYSQHLIFSLHLSSAIFIVLALAHLANLSRSLAVLSGVATLAMAAVVVYALAAFRRVYREQWRFVVLKGAAIGIIYTVALSVATMITYVWTVLT